VQYFTKHPYTNVYLQLVIWVFLQQVMPNHVVPSEYYLVIPLKVETAKQSSLVTMLVLLIYLAFSRVQRRGVLGRQNTSSEQLTTKYGRQ